MENCCSSCTPYRFITEDQSVGQNRKLIYVQTVFKYWFNRNILAQGETLETEPLPAIRDARVKNIKPKRAGELICWNR